MTLPALIISFFLVSAAWALFAFPGILSMTSGVFEACQSLLVRCVENPELAEIFFIWSGLILVSAGIIYASFRAAGNAIRARRAISALPVSYSGAIGLIKDDSVKTAFTCGLLSPRVYISTGLMKELDKDELRAVFLHELKHKKSYDPLRFLLLGFFKDAFFYLPAASHIASFIRLRKEHEADDKGADAPGGPLSLASAMVKVAKAGPAHAALADNTEQVSGRIRRLLDGAEYGFRLPARAALVSAAVSAALLFSLSMPIYAGAKARECTLERCEAHVDMVEGCREHCASRGASGHVH
ncbi:hypothetical protein ANRL2_01506 [Anaerolineae bacterium]|nr:hypothetical protein ANRL2_01506 [Anaerolineae bacterium]